MVPHPTQKAFIMRVKLKGIPKTVIREIQCESCGKPHGQSAFEIKRNIKYCHTCRVAMRKSSNPLKLVPKKHHIEIVLPGTYNPVWSQSRGEWAMKVKTRKSRSDEPYALDHVYLGLGKDADPEAIKAAYTAAYARLEMKGAATTTQKRIKAAHNKSRNENESWDQGWDKNLGIERTIVQEVYFKVHLPDPYEDGKRHYVGRFKLRKIARKERKKAYDELIKLPPVPCAVCGLLPMWRKGHLTHFTADCPNQIQMPPQVKPLFQLKLWNLRYYTGEDRPGKLTRKDFWYEGYLRRTLKGEYFLPRPDVEFNLSRAKLHVQPRPVEDVMFE
jgi:hypothetical protein